MFLDIAKIIKSSFQRPLKMNLYRGAFLTQNSSIFLGALYLEDGLKTVTELFTKLAFDEEVCFAVFIV